MLSTCTQINPRTENITSTRPSLTISLLYIECVKVMVPIYGYCVHVLRKLRQQYCDMHGESTPIFHEGMGLFTPFRKVLISEETLDCVVVLQVCGENRAGLCLSFVTNMEEVALFTSSLYGWFKRIFMVWVQLAVRVKNMLFAETSSFLAVHELVSKKLW